MAKTGLYKAEEKDRVWGDLLETLDKLEKLEENAGKKRKEHEENGGRRKRRLHTPASPDARAAAEWKEELEKLKRERRLLTPAPPAARSTSPWDETMDKLQWEQEKEYRENGRSHILEFKKANPNDRLILLLECQKILDEEERL